MLTFIVRSLTIKSYQQRNGVFEMDYEDYKKFYPAVVELIEASDLNNVELSNKKLISEWIREDRDNDVCQFDLITDSCELSHAFADFIDGRDVCFTQFVKKLKKNVESEIRDIIDAVIDNQESNKTPQRIGAYRSSWVRGCSTNDNRY